MRVIYGVDRGLLYIITKFFENEFFRMAEWSALQTGKGGDSGSIPVKVKTFFDHFLPFLMRILIFSSF